MSINIRPLPPALAEKARKELNEDPKRLVEDLEHIKGWIAKQPHLRARTGFEGQPFCTLRCGDNEQYWSWCSEYCEGDGVFVKRKIWGLPLWLVPDDQWLVTFLRGCKYSLERTKEKLDLYYTIRSTAPELFRVKYTDPIFEEVLNIGSILILPRTAGPDSPRVTLVRPGKYDPDKYNLVDIWSIMGIITKITLMDDDHTVVAGSVSILDLEGVTMSHFLQMTPANMKKLTVLVQDASPMRMKGGHYLNTPPGFETIFNAMKTFLNEKNRSRLHVHNKNYEELYKHVPKDILPAEYGGNGGTEQEIIEYWKRKVKEYSAFLEEDTQYGTDESKRPGKPRTAEDMFGAEGSFRKLEFD